MHDAGGRVSGGIVAFSEVAITAWWPADMPDESIRLVHASGECEIDLARRELRVLGSPVPVGGRAFEVIEVLARSAGEIVTKDELMDRIWPGAIVTENTMRVLSPRANQLPSIGAICRHLDGIPLAIEFAAAHASTFGLWRKPSPTTTFFCSSTIASISLMPWRV